ncbi:MAG: hypothetical protein ABI645_01785 [Pseudomonadota bacterium]
MGFVGLAQIALQHLGSYIELIGQAATEYRASILRRALYATAAVVTAVAALLSAWVTGLALAWDTQWRLAYCVTSVLVCLAATAVLVMLAMRRPVPGPHVRTLKDEATQDLALLQEWRRAQ